MLVVVVTYEHGWIFMYNINRISSKIRGIYIEWNIPCITYILMQCSCYLILKWHSKSSFFVYNIDTYACVCVYVCINKRKENLFEGKKKTLCAVNFIHRNIHYPKLLWSKRHFVVARKEERQKERKQQQSENILIHKAVSKKETHTNFRRNLPSK